jgi:hypothetical protein
VSTTTRAFELYRGKVGLNHLPHQRFKRNLVMPSELGSRLCGVAEQHVDFGRPEVARVYLDNYVAIARIHALFLQARTLPFQPPTDAFKRLVDKLSNGMRLARRQYVIIWRWLMKISHIPST